MKRRKPLRSNPDKLRAWERRSRKRIKRSGALRRSPLRLVGRRRKRLEAAGLLNGPLCTFVRGGPCDVPNCMRRGRPHHVDHGSGRLDWRVEERTSEGLALRLEGRVCCLCGAHHRLYHDVAGNAARFLEMTGCYVLVAAHHWGNRFKAGRPDEYRRILTAT